jgi:hypothetical protein
MERRGKKLKCVIPVEKSDMAGFKIFFLLKMPIKLIHQTR